MLSARLPYAVEVARERGIPFERIAAFSTQAAAVLYAADAARIAAQGKQGSIYRVRKGARVVIMNRPGEPFAAAAVTAAVRSAR